MSIRPLSLLQSPAASFGKSAPIDQRKLFGTLAPCAGKDEPTKPSGKVRPMPLVTVL